MEEEQIQDVHVRQTMREFYYRCKMLMSCQQAESMYILKTNLLSNSESASLLGPSDGNCDSLITETCDWNMKPFDSEPERPPKSESFDVTSDRSTGEIESLTGLTETGDNVQYSSDPPISVIVSEDVPTHAREEPEKNIEIEKPENLDLRICENENLNAVDNFESCDCPEELESPETLDKSDSLSITAFPKLDVTTEFMEPSVCFAACEALKQNYLLLKWSVDGARADTLLHEKLETSRELSTVCENKNFSALDNFESCDCPEELESPETLSESAIFSKTGFPNLDATAEVKEPSFCFAAYEALNHNCMLLKWSVDGARAETLLHEKQETCGESLAVLQEIEMTQTNMETSPERFEFNLLCRTNYEEYNTTLASALERSYLLTKWSLTSSMCETAMRTKDHLSNSLQSIDHSVVAVTLSNNSDLQNVNTSSQEASGISEELVPKTAHVNTFDCDDRVCGDQDHSGADFSSEGGNLFVNDEDDWESWSSDASVKSLDVHFQTRGTLNTYTIGEPDVQIEYDVAHQETQTDNNVADQHVQTDNDVSDQEVQTDNDFTEQEVQTDNDITNQEVQTEGEIVECCQCSAYSFKPLGDQFVMRFKEEMSQRLSLENLIRIVERDAWNIRQELMDEREGVIRLQAEAADLKGNLTHAEHVSAELKTRNDELETSLEGARNMMNRLEQQISNTTYFNSGIDYMLEAKLSQGRAVEALSKVQVLQNELLHSQSEVNTLLEQISRLSKEKNEMVSNSVHQELMQIADDKVKDAELRALQLENEVFALKEENKQLKSLSSSDEKTSPMMSSTTPYKFMFNEQLDPYKEVLAMKSEMLSLKSKALAYLPYTTSDFSHNSVYSSGLNSYSMPSVPIPVLPELELITESVKTQQTASTLNQEGFTGAPLIATGSESEDSDWSDEEEQLCTLTDVIIPTDQPENNIGVHQTPVEDVLYSLRSVPGRQRLPPSVPPKPKIPPKPKSSHPGYSEIIGHQSYGMKTFLLDTRHEDGTSFDQKPVPPHLSVIRKPRGPKGRQRPAKYSIPW